MASCRRRKTYEIFAAYWPYYDEAAPHGGIAKLFREIKKYVVSRSGDVDPSLATRFFLGLFVDYAIVRQVFGQDELYPQPPEDVADTYVSIFLNGLRADGPARRPARRRRG